MSPTNRRLLSALFLLGAIGSYVGCGTSPQSPVGPSTSAAVTGDQVAPSSDFPQGAQAQTTADVCHRTGDDRFIRISVATVALDPHLKHGDGVVGGPVPQHPDMTFDASCTPVQAATRVTLTFAGLSGDRSPFTTYAQSGFTVVPTEGSWLVGTWYGNPAPFILFETPAGSSISTATIRVTAGGSEFTVSSVDLYSSITPIPYTFIGMKGSATVFTVTATQPNTFGTFATVQNPFASTLIDTLVISLSDPAERNPMGLDNIVLVQ